MENKITRSDAVAEARAWLGTPFHHQASVKGVGCDCIGLIKGVGVALGLVDYDPASPEAQAFANYSMLPNSRRMREGLTTWLVSIPVSEATLADILFMAWGREPQHVALITDKGIIHSYSGVGKVVEHALDEDWKHRIVAAYRYPYFIENP
ncbi:MAG: peptidase P60 [Alphaproteobacteria bacterium]|nr:MAG: peptidase P60 [Alphaproteobacteria bacterium]